jgi:periplasmic protein TonB
MSPKSRRPQLFLRKVPGLRGKNLASAAARAVSLSPSSQTTPPAPEPAGYFSPGEIARAAGVPEHLVLAALGGADSAGRDRLVPHATALRVGRLLARRETPLFALFAAGSIHSRHTRVPFAVASTMHVTLFAAVVFMTTLGLAPSAATVDAVDPQPVHLVFVALPGPGGGGGGGGKLQKAPPPKAEREGRHALSSPLPVREPPKPIEATPKPPDPPKPVPIDAERLPVVVAPVMSLPADARTRGGVLEQTPADTDSRGPGNGGGVGKGTGTGLGEGSGSGIGPGSGGGTGGGVYRPGSGIDPPRLLREVKPDYTEDARQRQIEGEVVMEIVVRRDGSVGDMKVIRGLQAGLNDRAIQAVRQWRFSPARRQGTPVDVAVEVAVEFRLR